MIEELKRDLDNLNDEIRELEIQIGNAEREAEANIGPLNIELAQVKEDKRNFALKNDFDSIQNCRRKEDNLKFKINAQWNEYSILKNDLSKLNRQKQDLETRIKLEEDRIKRNNEIMAQMDKVLGNYRECRNLRQAAIDAGIDPNHAEQWYEWGKNDFNETYHHFHAQVLEIDEWLKDLEAKKLKRQMDDVIDAYQKTGSLEKASRMANVSYDTVQYWYEWGSRGFGEENAYFFKGLKRQDSKGLEKKG